MAGFLNRLGDELKKPGGAFRLPGFLGAEAGSMIGNKIMGNKQTSTTTPTVQTTQRKQVQTYNPRYPGFDEEDYLRLEQLVDQQGVTGSKKAQLMDEAYQYYYPQVLNKHKLDERQEMINQWTYDNGEKLANGDKVTNAKYRLLSLTQMAKEKFDIAYNVEDAQIIDSIKEKVPNGEKLLTDFLNTGNPEILYASGIYDKGQQAQDFRSQKDIANSVLGGSFWKNAWNNMYANSFAPLDSAEKFIYRGIKNAQMLGTKIDDYFADKNLPEGLRKDAFGDKTAEQIRAENQQFRDTARREIDDYIGLVNDANQRNRTSTVNPIVDNYYQRRNFTDLLAEGDIDGFFYKGLGDAASNRDMPVIIGASIVNPAMGTALMGTNSYVRESEEAYETMRRAGATHEQAEVGAGVVGLVNSAIEVYLDKMLGGTETTASTGIRDAIKKNVMKEVTNKPFEEIVSSATKTYVGSSLEEGLEEWLQNIVTNAAEMTVKENPEWKDLFEGGRAAAEGGIFNPFNILAPGGDIARNTDINTVKQSMIDGAYNLGVDARNVTDSLNNGAYNAGVTTRNMTDRLGITKDGATNTQGNVAVEGNEMVTEKTGNPGVIDRITDWGAEKITNTVSAQDKLYKAQEPRMNILSKKKDLEKRREHSDRANQLIVQNGYIPMNTAERLEAHEATMKNIWKQVEDRINGGQEIMVDLSQIADVLDEYIQSQRDTKSTLTEGDLAKLEKESQALRGQQVSLPVAERLKQLYNAVINNRGEEKASDTMANGLQKATHEIGVIEDNLLSEIPGEFQGLKNDFGALKDTYEDVFKADMKNQRKKGSGLTETYSRIEGIGDIANGLLGVATGKGDIASIGKGAAKFLVGKSLAKASDVDFLIEQGFKELAKQYGNNGNVTTNTTPTTPTSTAPTTRTTTEITEDIDVGENPTDLTATEEVMEGEVTTLPKKEEKKVSPKRKKTVTELLFNDLNELGVETIEDIDEETSKLTPAGFIVSKFNDLGANYKIGDGKGQHSSKDVAIAIKEYVDSHDMSEYYEEYDEKGNYQPRLTNKNVINDIKNIVAELENETPQVDYEEDTVTETNENRESSDYEKHRIKDTTNYKFDDLKNLDINDLLSKDGFEKYIFEEDGQKKEGYAGYINGKAVDIIPNKNTGRITINVGDELFRSFDDDSINVQLTDSDEIIQFSTPYDNEVFKGTLAKALKTNYEALGKPKSYKYDKENGIFEIYDKSDSNKILYELTLGDQVMFDDGTIYDTSKHSTFSQNNGIKYLDGKDVKDIFKGKTIIGISRDSKFYPYKDSKAQLTIIDNMDNIEELEWFLENKNNMLVGEIGGTPVKVSALNFNYDPIKIDDISNNANIDNKVKTYKLQIGSKEDNSYFYDTFSELKSALKKVSKDLDKK